VAGGRDSAFKSGRPSLDQHWYVDHRSSESQKGMPTANCSSFGTLV